MSRFNLVVSNWLSRASGTELGAWRKLADRQPLVSPKQHLPSHHEHTVHERTFDGVSWVRESILYVLILEIGGRRLDNGGELTMKYPSYAGIQEVEKFTNSEKKICSQHISSFYGQGMCFTGSFSRALTYGRLGLVIEVLEHSNHNLIM
jgi:hypothetical protein